MFSLGDSGYPLEPWLMTPYLNPRTPGQREYNRRQKGTRRVVENAIGLWKTRFRCICLSGGKLLYRPTKVCKIITACAVLHNIRRELSLPEDENFEVDEDDEQNNTSSPVSAERIAILAEQIRNELVQGYMS